MLFYLLSVQGMHGKPCTDTDGNKFNMFNSFCRLPEQLRKFLFSIPWSLCCIVQSDDITITENILIMYCLGRAATHSMYIDNPLMHNNSLFHIC